MNSLLRRQIRKYLPEDLRSNRRLDGFLKAIDKSYDNSDEQFSMLQRAMALSSEELYESNKNLKIETESQKEIISKLKNVIDTISNGFENKKSEKLEIKNTTQLVDFIDNQTKEIIKINNQKDELVSNLEKQNQELNDYAHMISHDLKSPLQSLNALTSWMKNDYEDKLEKEGKDIINLIKENVEKMDTLIDGILEYSTIGKIKKNLYDIDLNLIIDEIALNLNSKSNIIIPEKLPTIKGDNHRVELLFYHLIDNAIKYNKKENAYVEIGYKSLDDYWKFYIKDNGDGIEQKYFEKIFIAFQKLENNYTSSGIGLSIVKKIVEVYEGKIWLESTPNIETIFYFTLKK